MLSLPGACYKQWEAVQYRQLRDLAVADKTVGVVVVVVVVVVGVRVGIGVGVGADIGVGVGVG
eukprot:5847903-Alexandrium_andersonii.AAC.1